MYKISIMSVSEENPSELEVLRQRNAELEAKNVEHEVELEAKDAEMRLSASLYEEKINKFKGTIGDLF